ncbi:MAG: outer membrane beta-barrel protein [Bacteroidota bacterium]|jgi:outer membrane receptor protein involved in Fe transport
MYKKLIILLFLITNVAFAQNSPSGKITGKVIDASNNQALSFASVGVFQSQNAKDVLVGGVTIPENGEFVINNLPLGKLTLKVSFVGYQAVSQEINLTESPLDLGTIKLSPDTKMLQEVQVKGEKDQVSLGMDKRIFSVGKNLTTIGGTAESLLRSVPSLSIDESGNASLRNMATTIYINGKPTQLTLAQIPANQIESVEVISNPSARYDASTSGGIVNLVLKKNREAGFNGSVSGGFGSNSRFDGSLNLDYHEGKWNFTALYNANSTKNPLNGYVNRTNSLNGSPVSYFNQNTDISLDNLFQNGRVVVDYTADKFNTFSVAGTVVGGSFNTITNQVYDYRDAQQNITSYGGRTTLPQNSFTNIGVEFDWKRTFARKGRELSLVTSFTRNNVSNAADWLTTGKNADGTNVATYPETDKITGRQIGSQYLAQLDYVHPINDSTKFEMGLRSYTYGRDQQYFFNQLNNDTKGYTLLQNYSQDADVLETVNAAYFLYNHRLKNKITMEVGLRIEQSFLHGLSRFDNTTFGYDYPSVSGGNWFQAFFPTFALSKKFSEDSEIGFSLSRKVGRPNFRHVFVGIQSSDRQNITIGNPKIQPEFVNTAELNYSQNIGRLSWLASAYYIYEDHTIKPFTQPSATDPTILVTSFINAKADIQYGMDNTFKYSVGPFSATANINVFNFIIQSTDIQNELWTYRAKLNLSYRFPANFSAQVNLNRDSKSPSLQGFRLPVQAADFALRKSFMSNRASVVFAINDIFNSRKFVSTIEQGNTFQASMNRRDVRFYKITLQLPIGKANATFRKKERKMDKPDVDFSN